MNLVQRSISNGGNLVPLIIPAHVSDGMGLMNPSIFIDDDGDILVNIRRVNYTLYHSEKDLHVETGIDLTVGDGKTLVIDSLLLP